MQKYIEMTKRQLDEMNKNKIILVSVLSPIEIHGSHLPLGTDIMIASEVMRRTVEKLPDHNFVEIPPLCTGAQPLPVKGSIGVRYRTLYNLLIDFGKGLKAAGFTKWVIFDNHGGPSHMLAEVDASRKLAKIGFELIIPFIDIMSGMNNHDPAIGLDSDKDGSLADAHGGTNETSLYMTFNQDFSDTDYGKYQPKKSFWGNVIRFLGSESIGSSVDWINDQNHPSYVGNPSIADIDSGERMMEYHVSHYIDAINGSYRHDLGFNGLIKFLLSMIG